MLAKRAPCLMSTGNWSHELSIRIGRDYRALGILEGDTVTWYWIGKHDTYDRKLD
jgi:hypothetical protein